MWPDAYFEGLRSSPVGTFCPSICCPFQKLHALMITRICCRENSWNVNGTDRRIRIFLNILTKKTFSKTRSLWVGFACVMNVPGLHLSHLLLRLLLHGQEFNSTSFCYYILVWRRRNTIGPVLRPNPPHRQCGSSRLSFFFFSLSWSWRNINKRISSCHRDVGKRKVAALRLTVTKCWHWRLPPWVSNKRISPCRKYF